MNPVMAQIEQLQAWAVTRAHGWLRTGPRIRERIVKFVAAHSHISEDRFRQLMLSSGDMANDVGSVLYGEEAVTMGIIDRVGSLSDALDSLYRQMDRRREE